MAEFEQKTEEVKDWLVEDFPVDLRWRLKKVAGHKKTTMKEFVKKTIRKAVEEVEAEMLSSSHEGK
jgi:predicted DNA-binding protein